MSSTTASVPTTESIGSILEQEDVEPWEWFEKIRALGDVVWDPGAEAWLVTSFEMLLQMSQQDIDTWARPEQETGSGEWSRYEDHVPEGYTAERWNDLVQTLKAFRDDGIGRSMELVKLEGEEHDHQHRWWMSTLSPRLLDQWRETKIRPLVHEHLDALAGRDRAELCAEFVDLLVPRIIANLMGEPTDAAWVAQHAKWADQHTGARLTQYQANVDPQVIEEAAAAAIGLHDTLMPIVQAKRSSDEDDIISLIWRDAAAFFAEDRFGPYTEKDVITLAISIGKAGVSTVSAGTRNALYMLVSQPEVQRDLRAGGLRAIRTFAEESLRLYGPVDVRPRLARRDMEFGGVQIRKGDLVLGLRVAANRDPAKFECPAHAMLDRTSAKNHFSFYKGRRACPGQGLARMVMEETITAVLERTDQLALDPDAEPPRYTGLVLRRWQPVNALISVTTRP